MGSRERDAAKYGIWDSSRFSACFPPRHPALCPAALGVVKRFLFGPTFSRSIIMKQVTFLCIMAMASTGWCADPKDPAKDTAINGNWKLAAGEKSGEKMPDDVLKSIQLTLANGKYLAKVGDKTDQGTYTIDASKTPHTLTLTGTSGPNKGKTMLAIFELDKETLKVCYDLSGKAFPEKFESAPKTSSFLATYERQKSGRHPIRLKANLQQ
jgi:uncharacterized protein (TIGR03067 family)